MGRNNRSTNKKATRQQQSKRARQMHEPMSVDNRRHIKALHLATQRQMGVS